MGTGQKRYFRRSYSSDAESDFYAELGVPRSATQAEIKKAYLRAAKKHHPDVNPGNKNAEAKFAKINNAYETLNNAEKRRIYDATGMTGD